MQGDGIRLTATSPAQDHRDDRVGARPAAPLDRLTGPDGALGWEGDAYIRPFGRQPIKDTAPQRRIGIGRYAPTESPSPEARRVHDHDAPATECADHRRTPIKASRAPGLEPFPIIARRIRRGRRFNRGQAVPYNGTECTG